MRYYRLILLLLVVSCKTTPPTSTGVYSEDLRVHREALGITEVEPSDTVIVQTEAYTPLEGHIAAELDSISRISIEENKNGILTDGFIFQVYSGHSRDEANWVYRKMKSLFPELNAEVSYRQPNFNVNAGKFTDRLEAYRVYEEVKAEFRKTLLIPEKFLVIYE